MQIANLAKSFLCNTSLSTRSMCVHCIICSCQYDGRPTQ